MWIYSNNKPPILDGLHMFIAIDGDEWGMVYDML